VDGLGDRLGPGMTGVVQSRWATSPSCSSRCSRCAPGCWWSCNRRSSARSWRTSSWCSGIAFVAGGLRHGTQRFAAEGARTVALLLFLAVAVLIVPTVTSELNAPAAHHEVALSNVAAVGAPLASTGSQSPHRCCRGAVAARWQVAARRRTARGPCGWCSPPCSFRAWRPHSSRNGSSTPPHPRHQGASTSRGLRRSRHRGHRRQRCRERRGVRLAAQDKMDYALSIILQSRYRSHSPLPDPGAVLAGDRRGDPDPGLAATAGRRTRPLGGDHDPRGLRRGVELARGRLSGRLYAVVANRLLVGLGRPVGDALAEARRRSVERAGGDGEVDDRLPRHAERVRRAPDQSLEIDGESRIAVRSSPARRGTGSLAPSRAETRRSASRTSRSDAVARSTSAPPVPSTGSGPAPG